MRERAARDARERAEQAAQERAERYARERAEQEAREIVERARWEREAEEQRAAEERRVTEERRVEEERRVAEERRAIEERRALEERLQEDERARLAAQAKEDAAKTIQRAVLGSIVTFATGLDIVGLITSFECCSVRVRNLPPNAQDREVCDLFTQQGVDPTRFLLTGVKPAGATKEATVVMDAESGQVLSAGLHELPFRDQRLVFEVGAYNTPGQMGQSTTRDLNVLTVSWRAPSVRYVVTYETLDVVEAKIRELDGTMQLGRRIKVEKNTAPPGRVAMSIHPNSIKISNLPPSASDDDVRAFSHCLYARRLPTKGPSVDIPQASQLLRDKLDEQVGRGSVLAFDRAPDTGHDHGIVNFRVRFPSWDDAKRAHDYVKDAFLPYIGQPRYLKLPTPLAFNLTIPTEQFLAQQTLWTELCSSARDNNGCNLTNRAGDSQPVRRFQLTGMDQQAVGAMRVRVESLASGEKVDGWHASLATKNGAAARALVEPTGAYVRVDWRQRQIKVYGTPRAIEGARERIAEELVRLERIERTTVIPQQAVRFFVSQGVKELEDMLGQDNVKFSRATRALTVSGSDEAHHAVTRLLAQAAGARTILNTTDTATCPICFDDAAAPVPLGCGHTYCASCLRHFFASAADSDGDAFPLRCMGDEGRCAVPLALPLVERFVPPHSFARLLEAAFVAHVARHPQELRYCKTVDCARVYRASNAPAALQCSACLAVVCAACGEEGHEGVSCAEHRLRRDPEAQERAMQEWVRAQGGNVRKCPECARLLEKDGGCNHMSCQCVYLLSSRFWPLSAEI
jgi:GAF domain-containing protein